MTDSSPATAPTPEEIARVIVGQMSDDDRESFERAAWREGVSQMMHDAWEDADEEDVLDEIENLLRPS